MKKRVIAMVLVGGRGTRLEKITKFTAKPAVNFGGKYKLIDFVLSNLSNSAIDTVGMVTQYEPHELMNYIQRGATWDLDVSDGGVHFLTPYTSSIGEHWQKGTAHAIIQHKRFIETYKPDYVLILSGDHVYKMNYQHLINAHEQSKADVTIGTFIPKDSLSRYGVLNVNQEGTVTDFEEKPEKPSGRYASMGIYVFNKECLYTLLENEATDDIDFGKNVIPKALKDKKHVKHYLFEGYFRDVGTIESLYQANMELIDQPELLKLHDYKTLPLYTKSQDLPPHHIGIKASVLNSLVSDGSLIMGEVLRSIISSNVLINHGVKVENSIIHSYVKIGENAIVKNCILLENTFVLPNTKLLFDEVTVIDNDILWALGGAEND